MYSCSIYNFPIDFAPYDKPFNLFRYVQILFDSKWKPVWCQINRKSVITTQIWFNRAFISTYSSIFICFYKQQLWLAKISDVIHYSQSQLLFAKPNEHRTTSQKALNLFIHYYYYYHNGLIDLLYLIII